MAKSKKQPRVRRVAGELAEHATSLRLEWWPLDRVRPSERNAKTHPPAQVTALAHNIDENGWTQPLVVRSDGDLVAGHGRLEAARMLGQTEVPVIVRDDLTAEQARALRIADNKLAELGSWDQQALARELEALRELEVDVTGLGFTDAELSALEQELARDMQELESVESDRATAKRAVGSAGKPVIGYQLIFDDEDQQQRFFEFIRSLRDVYGHLPSVAARIDAWIAASKET